MQIEKRTLDYHDYRSGEPPECASLPVLKLSKGMKYLPVLDPFPKGTRRSKKTDTRPDFRLTRSRHPSASGRRIGSPPGDGWAARRDPETNITVFYGAGL